MTVLSAGAFLAAPAAQAATYYDLDFNRTLLTKEVDGIITERGDALNAYLLDGAGQYGYSTTSGNIGNIWAGEGVYITTDYTNGGNDPLGLFNSNCNTSYGNITSANSTACASNRNNGDRDLATGQGSYGNVSYNTESQGNLLIFEEHAGRKGPDDNAKGGTITFDVTGKGWTLDEIGFVDDIKNGLITYTFFDDSTETDTIKIDEENGLKFFAPAQVKEIKTVAVKYHGSGAISGLRFKELEPVIPTIPEPTAALGLIAFGTVATRLKRKQQGTEA